jgi:hypothetical protein
MRHASLHIAHVSEYTQRPLRAAQTTVSMNESDDRVEFANSEKINK